MYCSNCGANVPDGQPFCTNCGRPMGAGQQQQAAPPPQPSYGGFTPAPAPSLGPAGMVCAPWATRVLGYIIDSIFVMVVVFALYAVAGVIFGAGMGMGRMLDSDGLSGLGGLGCCCTLSIFPISFLIVGIYNRVILVSQRGYSIGQGVVKVKVVDANGQLLSQQTAGIRLLAQVGLGFIPFLGLVDLLWPLWDPARQTLHDKAVGSFVVMNEQ
ncbi:RDD family protein [uncultured Paludibaculum sp.]|uniref:RDD family protein n=1 Tax=uncultured Paludibaculum sp. TaxID=1765020 RepID=UPI002AAB0B40|nr:RDD family protein [uncultured Paludibaculum sp.]